VVAADGRPDVFADRALEGLKARVAELQPMPHAGLPDDSARAALDLACGASSFVNGRDLVVDGGHAGRWRWSTMLAPWELAKQPASPAHEAIAAAALARESRIIPIVFATVSDPIGSGFVASLAHPGGTITGVHHQRADVGEQMAGVTQGDRARGRADGLPV